MRYAMAFLLLLVLGCSKGQEAQKPVSNPATDYTKSLQQDVEKAKEAADKANKANAAVQEEMKKAQSASE